MPIEPTQGPMNAEQARPWCQATSQTLSLVPSGKMALRLGGRAAAALAPENPRASQIKEH
jgi:hypothetical protein